MSREIPYKDAWQCNGSLHVGVETEGVSFQANFKESGYYTVQFDCNIPGPLPGNQVVFPRAEILWSVEGTFVRREVTLARGNVISGAGQGVKVKMFDYSTLLGATPIEYFVSAQVVKGTRPNGSSSKPPILIAGPGANTDPRGTGAMQTLAGGTTGFWSPPSNSGANSFYVLCTPSPVIVTTPLTSNDFSIFQEAGPFLLPANYDQFGSWIPLHPSAEVIRVRNQTADSYAVAVFWGIEG